MHFGLYCNRWHSIFRKDAALLQLVAGNIRGISDRVSFQGIDEVADVTTAPRACSLWHAELIAISMLCCLTSCGSLPMSSERYPGPWQDIDPFVIRTLSKNISQIGPLC